MEPLYVLNGTDGQLELYEDKVVIKRNGLRARMTQGLLAHDKEFFIKQISGIQYRPAGKIAKGYIQIIVQGSKENNRNAVIFTNKSNEVALKIKEQLEAMLANNATENTTSAADEIKKFKELLDEGIITEEEFNQKKKQLLGL
ncbi:MULTISPECIES: SHOCT domain-containing protein [Thermoanaerobacterium]|uniref:SHOCT domain-containing protein n=2 Tax=Thermoanaerobacterium TaxID=28895 RepID=W9E9M9_9THEO|nr:MULTISPECIES: SHOCT domain-containing protein [Thermoanaerobacterium]AFK87415.1 hypothetical protein Tsac_2417 [Thermoanaerobacterium saccharolyticum JW/SL-YS485]ETO37786.1 hypothetical protein V518_2040 [Thermoanaerobacterium aotearoense SCUT27]